MFNHFKPHTYILIGSLPLLIYAAWVPLAQYMATSSWKSTKVVSTFDTGEKCQTQYGKGAIQAFNYEDRNMYVSRYWDVTYEVQGQKYPIKICTDAIKEVTAIYYSPDDPTKAEPELDEQYLHNLVIFLAISLFVGVLYLVVRTLPTLPTRPSI